MILVGLCLVTTAWHVGNLIHDAGVFKTLREIGVENCRRLELADGPEDFAYDAREQVVVISSLNRYKDVTGGLYVYDLRTASTLRIAEDITLYPHGICLFRDDSGKATLFVISHHPDGAVVHLFDWENRTARLRRTIRTGKHKNPNDLAALSHNSFFTTHDHFSQGSFARTLEDYGRLAWGYVTLFDGTDFSIVLDGLQFPNGIVLDQSSKNLYVAEMLDQSVVQYRVLNENRLARKRCYNLESGPDNLTLNEAGHIVSANHPKLLKLSAFRKNRLQRSPSEVVAIDPATGNQELLFQHHGNLIAGSSVALDLSDRLLIGSVFDTGIAICRSPGRSVSREGS